MAATKQKTRRKQFYNRDGSCYDKMQDIPSTANQASGAPPAAEGEEPPNDECNEAEATCFKKKPYSEARVSPYE